MASLLTEDKELSNTNIYLSFIQHKRLKQYATMEVVFPDWFDTELISFNDPELAYWGSFEMNKQQPWRGSSV